MRSFVLLLVLVGLVSSSVDDVIKQVRKKYTEKGPEFLEEAIDELWKHYTRDDLEPPQFYSPTYERDIIGKNMESYFGRPLYAFQGIQYGEPPTDANGRRFRPSTASKLYEGSTDPIVANHLGFKCPQSPMIGHKPTGEEDCLYLNVYTPYLPGNNESDPLPVMLFIHGGSFMFGDASLYMPTKLLEHDVILVTIHYRLGAFGFFTLDNEDAPGNSALYDQVLSIEWVNKYIADFGGDPNRVTIQGESAGAASSSYMLLIDQVKDLIHGVISESGSALEVWALDPDPRFAAEFVAMYAGCPIDNESAMYRCMALADQDLLVEAQNELVAWDRKNGLMGFRGNSPTIQNYDGKLWDPLIVKHPRESFESGEVNPVPLFIGSNKQEGSFVLGKMYNEFLLPNGLLDNEEYMKNQATADALYSFGVEDNSHSISNSFNDYYCPDVEFGTFEAVAPCYTDMLGVLFLKGGGWECANLHAYYTNNSTYHYSFDFMSDDTMYYFLLGAPPPGLDPGVTHSDELMYLFTFPAIMEALQELTMQRMTLLWTNFATYGDPTPDENPEPWQDLEIPKWPKFKTDDHHFMLMRNDFTTEIEFSDRWTITMDELDSTATDTTVAGTGTTITSSTGSDSTVSGTGSTATAGPDSTSTVSGTETAVTGNMTTVDGNGTTASGATGSTTENPCPGPTQQEYDDLQNDYDDLESKSTAYLACMIVFIVLFVIADGVCLYIFMKNR